MFNNPDFAFGLVNSVLNLPDGQVRFFKEFKLKKTCEMNPAHQKAFWTSRNEFGLVACEQAFGRAGN